MVELLVLRKTTIFVAKLLIEVIYYYPFFCAITKKINTNGTYEETHLMSFCGLHRTTIVVVCGQERGGGC